MVSSHGDRPGDHVMIFDCGAPAGTVRCSPSFMTVDTCRLLCNAPRTDADRQSLPGVHLRRSARRMIGRGNPFVRRRFALHILLRRPVASACSDRSCRGRPVALARRGRRGATKGSAAFSLPAGIRRDTNAMAERSDGPQLSETVPADLPMGPERSVLARRSMGLRATSRERKRHSVKQERRARRRSE